MTNMKKEKSCGAVIYKVKDGQIYYLLSKMGYGHVSLSKGHVELNETEEETAQREILEETSLKPIIDSSFRKVISYSPIEGVMKDVIFFVAEEKEDKIPKDFHDKEVVGFYWLIYIDALHTLTFKADQEVLTSANDFIKEKTYGKL